MSLRIALLLIIVSLFGLTGAKVGALWPQLQPEPDIPRVAPLSGQAATALAGLPRDVGQVAGLQRLNERLAGNPDDFEAALLKGLLLFQTGDLEEAIRELQALTERAPKFQLAHLVLGDLLLARFNQVDRIGASPLLRDLDNKQAQRIRDLQNEARARLQGYLSMVDGVQVPGFLLSLSNRTKYALVVDKSKHRLYVYRNPGPGLPPELLADYYIVLGKRAGDKLREGDLKTPNGVYRVTGYLADEKLPPLYGSGAFPVDYPNEFDRHLAKTGKGIWLHGTDKSLYSRPPLDSEGCVVLTNEEFSHIAEYVEVGRTPVIITEQVEWLSSREWLETNIEIQAALETWRQNWEQTDLDAYLGMYSDDFWSSEHDSNSWQSYKKQVFTGKTFQKIALSDLSVLGYPRPEGQQSMIVADFLQDYRSNNFTGQMHKRLYLVKETDGWKVLYEGGR